MRARNVVSLTKNGRSGVIRTHDPLLPKQMRYQAALRSAVSGRLPYTLRRTWATAGELMPFLLYFRGLNVAPFLDSQGLGAPGIQLDHELHQRAGRDGLARIGHGVFLDAGDGAVGAHEQHVQRQ